MHEDDDLYTMMHTPFEDDVDWSMYTVDAIEDDIYITRCCVPYDDLCSLWWTRMLRWNSPRLRLVLNTEIDDVIYSPTYTVKWYICIYSMMIFYNDKWQDFEDELYEYHEIDHQRSMSSPSNTWQ